MKEKSCTGTFCDVLPKADEEMPCSLENNVTLDAPAPSQAVHQPCCKLSRAQRHSAEPPRATAGLGPGNKRRGRTSHTRELQVRGNALINLLCTGESGGMPKLESSA